MANSLSTGLDGRGTAPTARHASGAPVSFRESPFSIVTPSAPVGCNSSAQAGCSGRRWWLGGRSSLRRREGLRCVVLPWFKPPRGRPRGRRATSPRGARGRRDGAGAQPSHAPGAHSPVRGPDRPPARDERQPRLGRRPFVEGSIEKLAAARRLATRPRALSSRWTGVLMTRHYPAS